MITESEFRALAAQGYNRIPLVLESFADLDTPLSLYVKLANARYSFLLESVVGGERFGRYSFIGLPAQVRLRARGRHVEVEDDGGVRESFDGDPLAFVESYRARFHAAPLPGLPRFCGGLAGIFGYDIVRHIETKLADTGKPPTPGLADIPDLLLAADRRAGGGRQPEGQDFADRLRESGGARSLRAGAGPVVGAAPQTARAGGDSIPDVDHDLAGAKRIRRSGLQGGRHAREGLHRGGRHHAGGPVAADEHAVRRIAAVAVPRVALAQSVAVHVLLRLRRFPRGRRVAGDSRAQGGHGDHAAADCRHAAARRHARGGRSAGAGTGERSEGARRACDAARSRAQRRRPRRADRDSSGWPTA